MYVDKLKTTAEQLLSPAGITVTGSNYRDIQVYNDHSYRHKDCSQSDYSERFMRMPEYCLLSCAGAFRTRSDQLWKIVLSKKGVKGGYFSIR